VDNGAHNRISSCQGDDLGREGELMKPVVLGQVGGTLDRMTAPYTTFKTDAKGRTVIPAVLRAQAGIRDDGDVLVGHVEDGRLIVETRTAVKRRLQAQAAASGASGVVERLLADRRAETELEAETGSAAEA
jgi:bifunctional DNA-binding transcriptional regulator/antitoxin component of YhaV-PrlF toxin-antitoxin module